VFGRALNLNKPKFLPKKGNPKEIFKRTQVGPLEAFWFWKEIRKDPE